MNKPHSFIIAAAAGLLASASAFAAPLQPAAGQAPYFDGAEPASLTRAPKRGQRLSFSSRIESTRGQRGVKNKQARFAARSALQNQKARAMPCTTPAASASWPLPRHLLQAAGTIPVRNNRRFHVHTLV